MRQSGTHQDGKGVASRERLRSARLRLHLSGADRRAERQAFDDQLGGATEPSESDERSDAQ